MSRLNVSGTTWLILADDECVRGVPPSDRAPLAAVLRLDSDVAELVARVDNLADRLAGQDAAEAVDVRALTAQSDAW